MKRTWYIENTCYWLLWINIIILDKKLWLSFFSDSTTLFGGIGEGWTKSKSIDCFDCCMRQNNISIWGLIACWRMKGFDWKKKISRSKFLSFFFQVSFHDEIITSGLAAIIISELWKQTNYSLNVDIIPGKWMVVALKDTK